MHYQIRIKIDGKQKGDRAAWGPRKLGWDKEEEIGKTRYKKPLYLA